MVQGEWGVGDFLDSLIEDETRPPECLRFGHCLFVCLFIDCLGSGHQLHLNPICPECGNESSLQL